MSKSIIWNQIKETFNWFTAKDLKELTGISYAQITKDDLQFVWKRLIETENSVNLELAQLQKELKGEGVKTDLSSCDGGVTGNEVNQSEVVINESEQIKQAIADNIPHEFSAVLGGQQQKQVSVSEPLPGSLVLSPKHYLKPKLELFAAMTEFVFLMECYLDLIGHFFNLSSSYAEISNEIYVSWCAITAICFNRYVRMPAIGSDNYSKLLNIWYQSA